MVGCFISPLDQISKVCDALWTQRIGALQVEQQPKAVEVPFDIIVARIPFLKGELSGKLRLSRRFEPDWNGRNQDLRALGVKIAAETLEVGAEVQHKASKSFV